MMILFHLIYDLNFFGVFTFELREGIWFYFGRLTALIFIFLVGISLTLSYSKSLKKGLSGSQIGMKNIKRGFKILGYGIIITVITHLLLTQGTIYFGILHFIGLAVIISYPFLRFTYYNIFFGILCILLGSYISQITIESPYLLWLGIAPHGLYTFDYYPLLPWFGVVLLGIFVGNILYENGIRKYCIPELGKNYLIRRMTFLGRHSLLIYLVHQPIIILILYGLGYAEISTL